MRKGMPEVFQGKDVVTFTDIWNAAGGPTARPHDALLDLKFAPDVFAEMYLRIIASKPYEQAMDDVQRGFVMDGVMKYYRHGHGVREGMHKASVAYKYEFQMQ